MEERPVVAQFDKNGDGRLNNVERRAAREWLAGNAPAGPGGFGPRRGGGGGGGFPFPGPPGGRGMAPSSPGPKVTPDQVRSSSAPLYDPAVLRTIFLEFENADWEQELEAFNNTDVEVPAGVIVDGKRYPDVGVHFRGMSSFMMVPAGSKRSLNLAFDFTHEDQRLLGYRTLNLLNANGDPTFLRPVLYADISRQYVPTPRANYVRVVINGESWGVYINSQQFNTDFTRDWFKTTRGARWKVPGSPGGRGGLEYLGDSVDAYSRTYDLRSRADPAVWTDLIRLCRTLNQTPPDKLEAALAPMLDVDGALKFLAVEMALVNSDGYWARASDYSIYQDERRRFHIIPHDVNEGLAEEGGRGGRGGRGGFGPPPQLPPGFGRGFPGGFGRGGVDLDPMVGLDEGDKPLRSKLLAVPALRARYLGYVREIAAKQLDWKTLEPRVRQYHALVAEHVKADTRKLYTFEAFESGVGEGPESLRSFVERRQAFLMKVAQ
jgi:hypothetical protein